MNNRLIAIMVVVIVIILAGVYLYSRSTDQSQNNTETNTSVLNETQIIPQNQINTKEGDNAIQTAISAEQARQLALQYIDVHVAYLGNATLIKWPDGKLVWTVPVIQNEEIMNGIVIDAQTGQNLGQG